MQAHGTGALNIDGCRIETEETLGRLNHSTSTFNHKNTTPLVDNSDGKGRWPANVLLDEEAAAMLDAQSGELVSGTAVGGLNRRSNKTANCYGEFKGERTEGDVCFGDSGGASRFFYTAKASRSEREEGLTGATKRGGAEQYDSRWKEGVGEDRCPRVRNTHPTVKPVDLMGWLCRLVTRPSGVILDPFMGSGSTGVAAIAGGFNFVGCEIEPEYVAIARARIGAAAPLLAKEA